MLICDVKYNVVCRGGTESYATGTTALCMESVTWSGSGVGEGCGV